MLSVTFNSTPPSTDAAEQAVRHAMRDAVSQDGSKAVLGMAFDAAGRALPDAAYNGPLAYAPEDGKIIRQAVRNGLSVKEFELQGCFARVAERRVQVGPIETRWLDAQLIFGSAPGPSALSEAMLAVIEKLEDRGQDIHIHAFEGNKSNALTWQQLTTSDGDRIYGEWNAQTGKTRSNWNPSD